MVCEKTNVNNCPYCDSEEISHGYSFPPMLGIVKCHCCDAVVTAQTECDAIIAWNAITPICAALAEKEEK